MSNRGRPKHPDVLTPREWEVLGHIRAGRSNDEIAARLGISLDGVKYHVSEILSKLGVDNRHDAARWAEQRAPRPWWGALGSLAFWRRIPSALPSVSGPIARVISIAVLAVAVGGLGLLALLVYLQDGGEDRIDLTTVPITELFTDPRPAEPDEIVELGPAASLFEPWDGESTILYDTVTGEEMNVGRGDLGRFSLDSQWMGWTGGPPYEFEQHQAWVINLETLERRQLSPGNFLHFVDGETVAVQPAIDRFEVVDLSTGERSVVEQVPPSEMQSERPAAERYELRKIDDDKPPFGRSVYTVVDAMSGEDLFEFTALSARPAGDGELVVATTPYGEWSNIFIVDLPSGNATFIASAQLHFERGQGSPLSANEELVVWTDDFCSPTPGKTQVYYRSSGHRVELDASLWVWLRDDGLIAAGAFGAHELIDPESLERVLVVPEARPTTPVEGSAPDVSWSSDYRYFSRGFAGGHGGVCF